MSSASRQPRRPDLAGRFRLRAVPAADVWHAVGTVNLCALGPRTSVTVALEARGLGRGDVAGLALFATPYAWLGVEREPRGFALAQFDGRTGHKTRTPLDTPSIFLRADCNLQGNVADFQYSADGEHYTTIGVPHALTRGDAAPGSIDCAIFCIAPPAGAGGGQADFAGFVAVTGTPPVPSSPGGRVPGRRRTRDRGRRSRAS